MELDMVFVGEMFPFGFDFGLKIEIGRDFVPQSLSYFGCRILI